MSGKCRNVGKNWSGRIVQSFVIPTRQSHETLLSNKGESSQENRIRLVSVLYPLRDRFPGYELCKKTHFSQRSLYKQVLIQVGDETYFFITDLKNFIDHQKRSLKIIPQIQHKFMIDLSVFLHTLSNSVKRSLARYFLK